MNSKNIIVLSQASREGGALSIYNQFIDALSASDTARGPGRRWYVFADESMPRPDIAGVQYVIDNDHSWMSRMRFDKKGLSEWLRQNGVTADCIVSFQNTSVNVDAPQVIYYHQSIPFFPNKWNPLRADQRTMWLYKHVYPYFVKRYLSEKTDVVVQTEFIKGAFVDKFDVQPQRVHVMFPDVDMPDIDRIERYDYEPGTFNYVYPANKSPFKDHITLLRAVKALYAIDSDIAQRIRLHLTISQEDRPDLVRFVQDNALSQNIIFHGSMSRGVLLSMLKASDGLLFPSTIETIGLPLIEAASLGVPVVAWDMGFARTALADYPGAFFIKQTQPEEWSRTIQHLSINKGRFTPIDAIATSWPQFIDLVLSKAGVCMTNHDA